MSNYYPEIELGSLLVAEALIAGDANDPLYLDRRDCPYDAATKEQVREFLIAIKPGEGDGPRAGVSSPPEAARPAAVMSATDRFGALDGELTRLFDELNNYSRRIDISDTKERLQYYRTATSLLDKLTSLSERIHNVRSVSMFHTRVLAVFDEILTPDQRTLAMEKLEQPLEPPRLPAEGEVDLLDAE